MKNRLDKNARRVNMYRRISYIYVLQPNDNGKTPVGYVTVSKDYCYRLYRAVAARQTFKLNSARLGRVNRYLYYFSI